MLGQTGSKDRNPIRWNEAKRSIDHRSYLATSGTRQIEQRALQRYTRRQMSRQR